ncbi:MAG: hypothetical protein U0Y68_08245 [Blastocatellia bacterium]
MAETTKTTGQATGTQPITTPKPPSQGGQQQASERRENWGRTGEREEMMDQAKQTVNEAYQRASRTVNETLDQAKEYGRENPGTTMAVAFGVGVGVGLLLASGVMGTGRSRSQRIVPPVMNALSEIASEFFRR